MASFNLWLKKFKIQKVFFCRFVFVLALVFVPFAAKADSQSQTVNSGPIDPVKAGEFAISINEYLPEELNVDPNFVVLNEMQKGNFTLAQKLAVNNDKNTGRKSMPTYEFKEGDTIESVAQKFGIHPGSILDASNIAWEDGNHINVGTMLNIPPFDTNASDDWKKAADKADEEKKLQEEREKNASRTVVARNTSTIRSSVNTSSYSGSIKIIGTSYEQCVPWARANSGVGIYGYAGSIQPNAYDPKVGAIALDASVGHASVVVAVGDDYIVVHEANWIRGKVTERTVAKSAMRGYVY